MTTSSRLRPDIVIPSLIRPVAAAAAAAATTTTTSSTSAVQAVRPFLFLLLLLCPVVIDGAFMRSSSGRVLRPALTLQQQQQQPFRYSTTTTRVRPIGKNQQQSQRQQQRPVHPRLQSSTTRMEAAASSSSLLMDNDINDPMNVLQIYPLECYEELRHEQQNQQQQSSTSTPSSTSSNARIETIHRIHVVRHAEGYHNVEKDYKTNKNRDARLTPKGMDQCAALAQYVRDHHDQLFYQHSNAQDRDVSGSGSGSGTPSSSSSSTTTTKNTNILVVTSTLTRCIQTALQAFPDLAVATTTSSNSSSSTNTTSVVSFVAHEGIRETVNYECDARRSLATLASEFPRIDFETAVGFSLRPEDSTFSATANGSANDDNDNDNNKNSDEDDTDDPIWNAYRQRFGMDYDGPCESAELHVVARRGYHFFQWLVQHYNNNSSNNSSNDTTTTTTSGSSSSITDVILCTHSAFLRCILSWNQVGGVPQQMTQTLDDRTDNDKKKDSFQLFEYCPTIASTSTTTTTTTKTNGTTSSDQSTVGEAKADARSGVVVVSAFEASMRKDYENCELRSFCLVQRRRQ